MNQEVEPGSKAELEALKRARETQQELRQLQACKGWEALKQAYVRLATIAVRDLQTASEPRDIYRNQGRSDALTTFFSTVDEFVAADIEGMLEEERKAKRAADRKTEGQPPAGRPFPRIVDPDELKGEGDEHGE
jgi:hypothetical protein